MLDVNRLFELNVQGFLKIFTKLTLYGFIISALMRESEMEPVVILESESLSADDQPDPASIKGLSAQRYSAA